MKLRSFLGLVGFIAIIIGVLLTVSYVPESQPKATNPQVKMLGGILWVAMAIISNFIMIFDIRLKVFAWLVIFSFMAYIALLVALHIMDGSPVVTIRVYQIPLAGIAGLIIFCFGALGSSVYDVLRES